METQIVNREWRWPKAVRWAVMSAVILGAGGWGWAYATEINTAAREFPIEKAKINDIGIKQDALQIDSEIMKKDISYTKEDVKGIKEQQQKQMDLLLQILTNTRVINNNTKDK